MGQIDKAAELVEAKLRQSKNDIRLIAITAIKALDDDDIASLCDDNDFIMDSLADSIINYMGRAK